MNRLYRRLSCFALAAAFAGSTAYADNVYAALHGTVTDMTGAVVSGATVTLVNAGTGIDIVRKTNGAGYYIFPQLQAGSVYKVTIAADGFEAFVVDSVALNVNDNRELDAKLGLGSASETVQVVAGALQVETANTQLEQLVTAHQLEDVPLEGRDAAG